jgi:hypothetical protein
MYSVVSGYIIKTLQPCIWSPVTHDNADDICIELPGAQLPEAMMQSEETGTLICHTTSDVESCVGKIDGTHQQQSDSSRSDPA